MSDERLVLKGEKQDATPKSRKAVYEDEKMEVVF